jgi:hypothetical protein
MRRLKTGEGAMLGEGGICWEQLVGKPGKPKGAKAWK